MKIKQVSEMIDTKEVAEIIGITDNTIRKNYINNKTRDKDSFVRAFSLGAILMKEGVSDKELSMMLSHRRDVVDLYTKGEDDGE